MEEDAEGLVGVVVEEVEGFGGAGVGEAVGGHAVGVDGAGFDEGEGAAGGADVPLAAEVAAHDAAALDDLGAEGQVLLLVFADEVEGAAFGEHFHALPEGLRAGGSADGVDDQVRADAFGEAPDGGDGVSSAALTTWSAPSLAASSQRSGAASMAMRRPASMARMTWRMRLPTRPWPRTTMTLPGWNGAMSVQRTAEALSIQ